MKVGDTVRSKSTNLLYRVVEKKKNRAEYTCVPVTAIMHPDEKFYFFDDEVDVVTENTGFCIEEKDIFAKAKFTICMDVTMDREMSFEEAEKVILNALRIAGMKEHYGRIS